MFNSGQQNVLMGSSSLVPPQFRNASLYMDFANKFAAVNGKSVNIYSLLSCTRSSTKYVQNGAGIYLPVVANLPAIGTGTGLLPEQAATNLVLQSQDFGSVSWTANQATVTTDQTVAPDNTTTADLLAANGTSNQHYVTTVSSPSASGTQYALSIYVKAGTANFFHIQVNAANIYAQFNLSTGAVVFSSAGTGTLTSTSATQVANGFWHFTVVFTQSSGSAQNFRFYPLAASQNAVGPSENSTASVYLWQAQLETGSFPTSPILTTTGSATRATDVITLTGAALTAALKFPQWQYISFQVGQTNSLNAYLLSTGDTTANNRVSTFILNGTLSISYRDVSGGVAANPGTSAGFSTNVKNAVARSISIGTNTDIASLNGAAPTTSSPAAYPVSPSVVGVGSSAGDAASGAAQTNGFIRRLVIGNGAKSSTQVQALAAVAF